MISSSRCLVHLEGEEPFPLYRKELSQYEIFEGGILPRETYDEIMEELLPRRACHRAMYLLQKMDRTEHQLRRKLSEAGYPSSVIDHAVEYVKSFHYIDDVRYAWNYIDYRKADRSRRQLVMELQEKGVSGSDIQAALDETEFPDEAEQILRWKEKKHFDPEAADAREKQRFFAFLQRRGYSSEAIRRVMQGLD